MALQSSGAITLAQIAAEFGGAAPHAISEYYRGGIYVPDTAANIAIPTSGQIKLSDFYGAQAAFVVTVTEGSASPGGNQHYKGFALANKVWNSFSNNFISGSAFGSRSPTTYNGSTVQGIYENQDDSGGNWYFVVVLSGALGQAFFSEVEVQGYGSLLTANASHSQNSGSTIWEWNVGSNISRWDGTGTSTVSIT